MKTYNRSKPLGRQTKRYKPLRFPSGGLLFLGGLLYPKKATLKGTNNFFLSALILTFSSDFRPSFLGCLSSVVCDLSREPPKSPYFIGVFKGWVFRYLRAHARGLKIELEKGCFLGGLDVYFLPPWGNEFFTIAQTPSDCLCLRFRISYLYPLIAVALVSSPALVRQVSYRSPLTDPLL